MAARTPPAAAADSYLTLARPARQPADSRSTLLPADCAALPGLRRRHLVCATCRQDQADLHALQWCGVAAASPCPITRGVPS